MKNLKVLFLTLILAVFVAPNLSSAQATFLEMPAILNFDLDGRYIVHHYQADRINVDYIETRVLITPEGDCQIKAEFSVLGTNIPVPDKGKVVVPLERLGIQVKPILGVVGGFHFTTNDAHIQISSDYTAKIVYNWEAYLNDY